MSKTVTSYLSQSPWFQGLPHHCQNALLKIAKVQQFVSQEVIHAKDQPSSGLYYVCDGKIRISNFTPEGKEVILTWLIKGDWFGEISLFDQLPRTHQATVDVEATVINIPHKGFQQVIANHPELYEFFIPIFCQRIRLLFELIEEARTLPIKQQLVKRLLHLSKTEATQAQNSGVLLDVSQETLALMLNTTRQSVNRWLRELQEENILELSYNKIDITDKAKLQHYLDTASP